MTMGRYSNQLCEDSTTTTMVTEVAPTFADGWVLFSDAVGLLLTCIDPILAKFVYTCHLCCNKAKTNEDGPLPFPEN